MHPQANVMRSGAAALAGFALSLSYAAAAGAQNAPPNGLSAAQWASLSRLKHSALILPAYLPGGYRVVGVAVMRNTLMLGGESYTITYGNGRDKIEWYVSNVQAGGDAPPASFRAEYDSHVIGRGVVYSDSGCWMSRLGSGGVAGENYQISGCGPDVSPQAVAAILDSMRLVFNRAPRAVNQIWDESVQKHQWVIWPLAQRSGRYFLEKPSYGQGDLCVGGGAYNANDARLLLVQRYYEYWSDGRFKDAWNELSPRYQSEYGYNRWLSDHTAVRDIGAVTLCPIDADRVAAEVWWVDK
jgi:hypothetical protein